MTPPQGGGGASGTWEAGFVPRRGVLLQQAALRKQEGAAF